MIAEESQPVYVGVSEPCLTELCKYGESYGSFQKKVKTIGVSVRSLGVQGQKSCNGAQIAVSWPVCVLALLPFAV